MSWKGSRAGGGAVIKNIIQGTVSSGGSDTFDLTIPSVDVDKCVVLVEPYLSPFAYDNDDVSYNGYLTSPTNLRFERYSSGSGDTSLVFTLIEFDNIKSLQKGAIAIPASGQESDSVSINSVDTTKSLSFINFSNANGGNSLNNRLIGSYVGGPTTLLIKHYPANATYNVYWHVVEFE